MVATLKDMTSPRVGSQRRRGICGTTDEPRGDIGDGDAGVAAGGISGDVAMLACAALPTRLPPA